MTTTPDTKPAKPIRDRYVFVLFHDQDWTCVSCGRSNQIVAHHILRRSQGGDDVMANLAPLCDPCHGAYHGNPYKHKGRYVNQKIVSRKVAEFVRGDEAASEYLVGKLTEFGAELFVQRLEQ